MAGILIRWLILTAAILAASYAGCARRLKRVSDEYCRGCAAERGLRRQRCRFCGRMYQGRVARSGPRSTCSMTCIDLALQSKRKPEPDRDYSRAEIERLFQRAKEWNRKHRRLSDEECMAWASPVVRAGQS